MRRYREDRANRSRGGVPKPPLCQKGRPCGYTCINKNLNCHKKLQDLFGDSKEALNTLAKLVKGDLEKRSKFPKPINPEPTVPKRRLPDAETIAQKPVEPAKQLQLTGTPKQIAWAEKIAKPAIQKYPDLAAYNDASFWIDNRDVPYHALYLYDQRKRGKKFTRWHTWTADTKTVTDRYAVFGAIPKEKIYNLYLGISRDAGTFTLSSDRDKLREEGLTTIPANVIAPWVKRQPAAWVARLRQNTGDVNLFPIYDNNR